MDRDVGQEHVGDACRDPARLRQVARRVAPPGPRVAEAERAEDRRAGGNRHDDRRARREALEQCVDTIGPAGRIAWVVNAGAEDRLAGADDACGGAVVIVDRDAVSAHQRADIALALLVGMRAGDGDERAAQAQVHEAEIRQRGDGVARHAFEGAPGRRDAADGERGRRRDVVHTGDSLRENQRQCSRIGTRRKLSAAAAAAVRRRISYSDRMAAPQETEAWQRGPVAGFDPLLMPVVHALIQVREDVERLADRVPAGHLWDRPGGAASIGFHVRHAAGAVDRLFTYARGEALTDAQRAAARQEGEAGDPPAAWPAVLREVNAAIDRALDQLRATPADALLQDRKVGRAGLPSNVLGLLFHAAEHATRHVGQAITTAKILAG